MSKQPPQPRPCAYFGCPLSRPPVEPDGTWVEDEAFCYPAGGMTRRAYVRLPDGTLRVVRCGLPDTLFSIPARYRPARHGAIIHGFVTVNDTRTGLNFSPYPKTVQDERNRRGR